MNEVNIDLPELWKCYKAKYMLVVLYQYTVTPLQQEREKAANQLTKTNNNNKIQIRSEKYINKIK